MHCSLSPSPKMEKVEYQYYHFDLLCSDLRARLELAVDHMLDACSQVECVSTTTGASTDDEPEFLMKSPRVTTIARKQLATAVRDLMQHGLIQASALGHPCASSISSLLHVVVK